VIDDEAEGRINYLLAEIENECSNCFSTILTKVPSNNDFQLFLYILSSVKVHILTKSRGLNCDFKHASVYARSLVYSTISSF